MLELLVGFPAERPFSALRSGVGVGGANQHFLRLPSGLFGSPGLGEVGHIPSDSDGVDEADNGSSFAALEGHRPDMQWIMDVVGLSGAQLNGEDRGSHVNTGGSRPELHGLGFVELLHRPRLLLRGQGMPEDAVVSMLVVGPSL